MKQKEPIPAAIADDQGRNDHTADVPRLEERPDRHRLPVCDIQKTTQISGLDRRCDHHQDDVSDDEHKEAREAEARFVAVAGAVGLVGRRRCERERQPLNGDGQNADDDPVHQRRDDERDGVLGELVPCPRERLTDVKCLCARETRACRRIATRCARWRIARVLGRWVATRCRARGRRRWRVASRRRWRRWVVTTLAAAGSYHPAAAGSRHPEGAAEGVDHSWFGHSFQ